MPVRVTRVTDRVGGACRGEVASPSTAIKVSTSPVKQCETSGALCFCTHPVRKKCLLNAKPQEMKTRVALGLELLAKKKPARLRDWWQISRFVT